MAVPTPARKPLGVRATPREHAIITRAAAREGRSVNSFVLRAALQAADSEKPRPRRTPEEIRAILAGFRDAVQSKIAPGQDILGEFLDERRAEAARE